MRKAAKGEGIKLGNKEVLTSTQQSLQSREQQTYKYVQLLYTALSETGKRQRFQLRSMVKEFEQETEITLLSFEMCDFQRGPSYVIKTNSYNPITPFNTTNSK